MKFGHAFLILSAMTTVMHGVQGDKSSPVLRGLKTSVSLDKQKVGGFEENLGQCEGAICGK